MQAPVRQARGRRGVFVDTSAWFALADLSDAEHAPAATRLRQLAAHALPLYTTNYVASETYTLIRVRLGSVQARQFLHALRSSAQTRRVHVPEAWESLAEALLAQYADQDFSYVDATSFVAMRQLGLADALTFDHHFQVAGFSLYR